MIHMLLRCSRHAKREFMPRPASANTFQVAFKIPEDWVKAADALAMKMGRESVGPIDVTITRTDVLRAALFTGLREMKKAKKRT